MIENTGISFNSFGGVDDIASDFVRVIDDVKSSTENMWNKMNESMLTSKEVSHQQALYLQYEMSIFSMNQDLLTKTCHKVAQSIDQVSKTQ